MEEFWILILVSFFAINSFDKAETVQLEKTPPKIIDEIFGEGWWDKDKAEEWRKLTLEHNFHHQINRQNTQLGQIKPNSTDQNPPLTESDHSGQIEPNSSDQNLPLTESDHSDSAKNCEDQNEITSNDEDERKRKIINKFHAMKEEFKQKRKYSTKERTLIEGKIANHLKVNRKIYELKQKCGLSQKVFYEEEERKHLIKKFDQIKAELNRDGFKNSYHHQIDVTVAKELGVSFRTIYNWKRKLGQTEPKHKYSHSEQTELLKRYYQIKDKTPKNSDKSIAKKLKIDVSTLRRWKTLYPNVVDGHSVEEDAASNVQKIVNIFE